MKSKVLPALALFFVLGLLVCRAGFAAIYQYIDNNGIICFADDFHSIPEQCRSTAKKVSDEQEEEARLAIQKKLSVQAEIKSGNSQSSSDVGTVAVESGPQSLFSGRVLISVVVVVSALFAVVILGILETDHKKAIKIVRVVILWGMSVYLIAAHGGDVVNLFSTMKGNVDTVHRESEEKGKKAAQAMKQINAVIQHVDDAASPDPGGSGPEKRE